MSISVEERDEVLTLLPEDKNFKFSHKFVQFPRAAIMISEDCPENYKSIIYTCQAKGWLQPIAYVPTKEFIWEKLKE
jgi:hypothetical protein